MPDYITVGQIAFRAYYAKDGITNPAADAIWQLMSDDRRGQWEAVGQAVQSFYETGIPGAA